MTAQASDDAKECECGHAVEVHDDTEGCAQCHLGKTECAVWVQFRDAVEEFR